MPSRTARKLLGVTTRATAEAYRRDLHLPRLLALWPAEIADDSEGGRLRIVARLHRALRAERARGRAGHWTYDLNRHIALLGALKAETARLSERDRRKWPAVSALSRASKPGDRPIPSEAVGL